MSPKRRPTGSPRSIPLVLALVLAACGLAPTPQPSNAPTVSASPASSEPDSTPTPLPSIELPGRIVADDVRQHLLALQEIATEHEGVRTAGTEGYAASVEYVAGELREMGYQVATPEFTTASFRELPGGEISVLGGPTFQAGDDFHAMIYSASGDVSAEVATVGFPDSPGGAGGVGCSPDDWEAFPEGAIALVAPGPCRRRDNVELAQEAGAVAMVAAYDDWEVGEARRPTLIFPDGIEIPVLSAIGAVGEALQRAADDGTPVRIEVETEIGRVTLRNVIAQAGAGARVAMIGAHLDSVLDGPGINDNGSGTAAVLEIARMLADADIDGAIRFGFWGAEEFGLHGSRAYVTELAAAERDAIVAYLNLDMLGSVNGVPLVYADGGAPAGSDQISDFLVGWLESAGIGAERQDLGGGSDHYFFAEAGIPTGGIFSGATERKSGEQAASFRGSAGEPMDPCYHLACDTTENVDASQVAAFAEAAAAAALLIAGGELVPD